MRRKRVFNSANPQVPSGARWKDPVLDTTDLPLWQTRYRAFAMGLVEKKMQERQDAMMKKRIDKMKPTVDNKPPPSYEHMKYNLKKQQQEDDRLTEIERENGILLDKLSRIASRKEPDKAKALEKGAAPRSDMTMKDSNPARKAELQRIAEENQQLLKRIQDAQTSKSDYNKEALDEEFQKHEAYCKVGSKFQE
ncbi:hypothetical protein CYMTET_7226 [Cymbomonas tetramitiformis]|uniref:Uncharacterized protein n=1 Tax=Cymbomonas tetramitiformis TaxID=36881 RepID=A0AAE0LH78_9CHLO|nr:hypothetical protein CYMTET_7226 [Cymbomonas tetramitiformis]